MNEKKLAKHWWAILLRGVVAIIFALLAIFATGFTLDLLLIFLGVYLLLDGLFAIIGSVVAMSHRKKWWLLLLEGLFTVAASMFILLLPGITLVISVYIIAIWAIVTGIFEFLASIMVSWAEEGKIFIGVVGVLSVVLGMMIFIYPTFSVTAIIWLVGIYALVIGFSLLFLGLKLKAVNTIEKN